MFYKMELAKGQIWRHFKGWEVEVLAITNYEDENLVIMKHTEKTEVWARPLNTWFESVDSAKDPERKQNIRFKYLRDVNKSTYRGNLDIILATHTETNELLEIKNINNLYVALEKKGIKVK